METKDAVLDLLKKSGEPLKSGEISEKSGLDKKDVDKALKQLKNEGLIDSPKKCYYGAK